MRLVHTLALAFALASAPHVASAALAGTEPSTRLVRCETGNCLQVSGQRDSSDSEVRISGHRIAVQGKRNWKARLPMEAVREWSAPFARTIEVSLHDPRTQRVSFARADLPIGLMGHTDLASLVVSLN